MANTTYGAVKLATLGDMADAIRAKSGSSALITPDEMPAAIAALGANAQFVLEDIYHPKQFLCPWINLWESTTRGWEMEFNITRDSGANLFAICNRMYTGSANKGFLLEANGNSLRFSGNNCGFGVFTVPFTDGKTYKIRRNYNEPTNMYIYEDGVLIHTEDQMEIYTDYSTPFNFFGNSGNTADVSTYQPGTINSFKFKFLDS